MEPHPRGRCRREPLVQSAIRHPIHPDRYDDFGGDWEFWSRHTHPLSLGITHRVDTTAPVDIPALATAIRTAGEAFTELNAL